MVKKYISAATSAAMVLVLVSALPACVGNEFVDCMENLPNETDEQAYLQLGGPFDMLKHSSGVKMTRKIDGLVRATLCDEKAAGLTLGIVWHGNLVYVKGYGRARGHLGSDDIYEERQVRGQRTRFRWASISKTLTGLASSIANQEVYSDGSKLFDLDRSIKDNYANCNNFGSDCEFSFPNSYYTNWNGETNTSDNWPLSTQVIPDFLDITPRMLLSCRSGSMHYNQHDPALSDGRPTETQKEDNPGFVWAVDQYTSNPMLSLPTTRYNYSSFGFNAAGAALDVATRSLGGYEAYVRSRIFNKTHPVEMRFAHPDNIYDPQYLADPWYTGHHRAHGYRLNDDGEVEVIKSLGSVHWKLPSGGYISTGADLALYAEGLLNYRFLSKARSDEMWTPQAVIVGGGIGNNPTTGYALGFNISIANGERQVSHNGAQQAARSRLVIYPDGLDPATGKLGIVIMSNSEYLNVTGLANEIEELLREPLLTVPTQPLSILSASGSPQGTWESSLDDRGNRVEYTDPAEDLYREAQFVIPTDHPYDFNHNRDRHLPSPDEDEGDVSEQRIR